MKSLTTILAHFGAALCLLVSAANVDGAPSDSKKKRKPRLTTAYSIVSETYRREKLPNGEWKPETYAFGKGKMLDPTERDESLSDLTFEEIVKILAGALAKENYEPVSDPEQTDLMIIVSWGKTIPFGDGIKSWGIDGMSQAMNSTAAIGNAIAQRSGSISSPTSSDTSQAGEAQEQIAVLASELSSLESEMISMAMLQDISESARRKANDYNARLLGYAPELKEQYAWEPIGGPQRSLLDNLVEEIETPRYFVILQAYDFRTIWKEKKRDLRWTTRFSIRAKGRRFDEELVDMALAAASQFGNDSGKLKRNLLPGEVKMGELEVIGIEEKDAAE